MKREDKNRETREQILKSAMKEFGEKTFSEASLNTISREGNLSKGIIYHYFKNKEDLYLSCVSRSIQDLVAYLKNEENFTGKALRDISTYFTLRHGYFEKDPIGKNLFSSYMMHPPKHLQEEIQRIRQELDEYNQYFFGEILDGVSLREEISREDAMDFFQQFQESFHHFFSENDHGTEKEIFERHEEKLKKYLPILFYGIAKE